MLAPVEGPDDHDRAPRRGAQDGFKVVGWVAVELYGEVLLPERVVDVLKNVAARGYGTAIVVITLSRPF